MASRSEPERELRPENAFGQDDGSPGEGARESVTQLSKTSAVGPSNRNGYARVVGRIMDLIASSGAASVRHSRVSLSRVDEGALRDADERQLGASGVAVSQEGSRDDWRSFLRAHFSRQYDLLVMFDASETSVR